MGPEVIDPGEVGADVEVDVRVERISVFKSVLHFEAAVGVVEVDDESDEHSDGGHQGVAPQHVAEQTPAGGSEGTAHTALLGAPLGVEPHRTHYGQHQVDEEEEGEGQTLVHLLCASVI